MQIVIFVLSECQITCSLVFFLVCSYHKAFQINIILLEFDMLPVRRICKDLVYIRSRICIESEHIRSGMFTNLSHVDSFYVMHQKCSFLLHRQIIYIFKLYIFYKNTLYIYAYILYVCTYIYMCVCVQTHIYLYNL